MPTALTITEYVPVGIPAGSVKLTVSGVVDKPTRVELARRHSPAE
jgi:hypothetical protein